MPHVFATVLVAALGAYAGIGLLFAAAFVLAGVHRIDERAAGAGWGFRALILPGSAALWPLLAYRWARARKDGE
jgi:hypothetical protein